MKTYNGWTNYETWLVKLWIMDNDEASYRHYQEMAKDCWRRGGDSPQLTESKSVRYHLADALKEEFEEGKNDLLEAAKRECSVWADLIGAALSEVNWDEIANSLLEAGEFEGYEPRDYQARPLAD